MNILIIGGNRFVGYLLTWRLLARGERVTLVNRGSIPDPFGDNVQRIRVDRTTPAFTTAFQGTSFDAIVDFAAFNGQDIANIIDTFSGRIGHYIFISTGQVYLVKKRCGWPAREEDYDGAVLSRPSDALELNDWLYGVGKRAGEDALAAAWQQKRFPSTRLRLPMVNGERDYYRRIESYFWRILDGGPLLVPESGEHPCRHVYGDDVAKLIAQIIGDERTFGQAFNLSQEEQPSLRQLLTMLADRLAAPLRLHPISNEVLATRDLRPVQVSPFSDRWMSRLDPSRARRELGFTHQPLEHYIDKIVTCFLNHPPHDRPDNYRNRQIEIELAGR